MRLGTVAFVASLIAAGPSFGATIINDPTKFVTAVYENLSKNSNYNPPEDIYTPRLKSLWADEKHDAGDEVGRIDFDFWVNAQDFKISGVKISDISVEGAKNRKIVVAKFKNMATPTELHFYFERMDGGWKLDDVRSAVGEKWTLSLILEYGWDDAPAP